MGFKRLVVALFVSLLSVLFCSQAALALDPNKAITQYVHDVWTMDEGLPQNSVLAITQTRDGYLWLGTWQGLVRFDGLRFTVFDSANTKEMTNNSIMALYEDREGSLWIGTRRGGVNRLKDGEMTSFTAKDGLCTDEVWGICEDQQRSLWFATPDGGLSRFKDGHFTCFTTRDGLARNLVRSVFEGRAGNLWIGTYAGLSRFKDGTFTNFTTKDGLSHDWVGEVYEDREGTLWAGTYSGLNRFKDGKFTTYTTKDGLAHDWVLTIYEDREGNLWVGTHGGLSRFEDGSFSSFTTEDGLSSNLVVSIYEDREGSLWVGTEGGGLDRFKDGAFTAYTTREGLSHDIVDTIYEDRAGDLWIGTYGGLDRFKDGTFTNFMTEKDPSEVLVRSIYEDRAGNLWIGTYGGLRLFKDGEITTYAAWMGLVWSIYEDREGTFWVGTEGGGLYRLEDGKFTAYRSKGDPTHNFVRSIYEDREGNLWVGTEGGLRQFKDGKFVSFSFDDGGSENSVGVGPIYEDSDGVLWIASRGDGLIRYRDGEFTTYTVNEGLFDNMVLSLLEDGKGNLWMGGYKGIFRVSKKQLNDFAEGKVRSITSVPYGTDDGLKSREGNSGQPSAWKSRDGKLWFPTVRGLVMIDADNMKINTLPPPVVMERAIIDRNPIDRYQGAVAPPGRGELEFHYTALSFLDPSKVKFKYRLEGYNRDWVDAGTRRVAYYINISPGEYRFRVIACNNDGVWNKTGASLEFRLQPHYYQRTWFYILCALVVGLVGLGLHRFRIRQLRAREQELAMLVDKRTKDLEELNQNLEQRVSEEVKARGESERMAAYGRTVASVAHEVLKPVSALKAATYVLKHNFENWDRALAQLRTIEGATERMENLTKELLEFAKPRKLLLAPADPRELLEKVVEIYCQENGSEFPKVALVRSTDLPKIVIDQSRMEQVLLNLIQNAAKHARGVTSISLSVDVIAESSQATRNSSQVCVRVKDDGAGIAPGHLPHIFEPFFTTGQGWGLGLAIVQRIIQEHGGAITVESELGRGTLFTICLPALMGE